MSDRPTDPVEARVAPGEAHGALSFALTCVEATLEQIDKRLTRLASEVTTGFREVRSEMRRMLYWILGLVVVGYLVPIALERSKSAPLGLVLRFVPGP